MFCRPAPHGISILCTQRYRARPAPLRQPPTRRPARARASAGRYHGSAAAGAETAGGGATSGSSPNSCTVSAAAASWVFCGRGRESGMPQGSTNRSPTASHSQHKRRLGAWARRSSTDGPGRQRGSAAPGAEQQNANTVLRITIPPRGGRRRAVRESPAASASLMGWVFKKAATKRGRLPPKVLSTTAALSACWTSSF